MPNPGQRYRNSAIEGKLPKLNLNDDGLNKIIDIIRKPNDGESSNLTRTKLLNDLRLFCNHYLQRHAFELAAKKSSDYRKILNKKQKIANSAKDLAQFLHEHNIPYVDKFLEADIESSLLKQFRLNPTPLGAGVLVESEKPGSNTEKNPGTEANSWKELSAEDQKKQFGICLNPALFNSIVNSILEALTNVEEEFKQYEQSDFRPHNPGDAFYYWLHKLKFWAKKNGFSTVPFIANVPSNFSCFMYELNDNFPENLRTRVQSAAAMAERIKKANRKKV